LIGLGAPVTSQAAQQQPQPSSAEDLLGLGAPVQANQAAAPQQSIEDLLGGSVFPAAQPAAQAQPVQPMYSLDNMLGGGGVGAGASDGGLMGINMGAPATPDVALAANSDCDGEKF